ncbi:hypothetical protein KOW79_020303 [Hemibagrus wyckioides]|uniref:Uncharacterized protein n=1 Tax=Hemibagrus wyckioides TaxID=337641 RepID=A0A9D3SAG9_9TELE|nr:hypothetical protein KOW79_020303 [Hemibagrus wyckioides]
MLYGDVYVESSNQIIEKCSQFGSPVGNESSYGLENTEVKTEAYTFPVKVPPGKTIDVDITIGRATFDLPYTSTVQITWQRDGV